MADDFREALKDVERDRDGIVVLSPYGFAVREINGKKYLTCLTKEEYEDLLKEQGISILPGIGTCYTPSSGGYCLQGSCTRNCVLVGTMTCVCSY